MDCLTTTLQTLDDEDQSKASYLLRRGVMGSRRELQNDYAFEKSLSKSAPARIEHQASCHIPLIDQPQRNARDATLPSWHTRHR